MQYSIQTLLAFVSFFVSLSHGHIVTSNKLFNVFLTAWQSSSSFFVYNLLRIWPIRLPRSVFYCCFCALTSPFLSKQKQKSHKQSFSPLLCFFLLPRYSDVYIVYDSQLANECLFSVYPVTVSVVLYHIICSIFQLFFKSFFTFLVFAAFCL